MPFDPTVFKNQIDHHIDEFLHKEIAHYKEITQSEVVINLLSHLKAVSGGGKRIRPLLVFQLYKHTHRDATPADIMPLLLAVELFHVFCLIHDDIMDEAALRHGVATIHEYAQKDFYSKERRIAENQAILVGDILFNSVFKLLHTFTSTHEHSAEIISLFHTLIDEVCIGQMLDVDLTAKIQVSMQEITAKNRLKTAFYSVVRPLELGAIIAGRDDLKPFIISFGEQVGLLYQTQDDLLDVIGDTQKTQKPRFQDVVQNQHTLLSTFITQRADDYSKTLTAYIGKPLERSDEQVLESLFIDSGAIAYARQCIDEYQAQAELLITTQLTSEADKDLFTAIMNSICKRTH